ncbi:MAG: endonuclease/exonuclease/phosphatase family protein, partial [Acidimicrobiales bacterium]
MTWNIRRGGLGRRGPSDTAALVAACAGLGADVLGLQEVDVRVRRSGRVDQPAAVAAGTGMAVVFGRALRLRMGGHYGNALAVRGRLLGSEVIRLPRHRRREPRALLVAVASVAGMAELAVGVTHLSVDRAEALDQLGAAVACLAPYRAPAVLLGDLNLGPEVAYGLLAAAGYTVVGGPPSYPADEPRAR